MKREEEIFHRGGTAKGRTSTTKVDASVYLNTGCWYGRGKRRRARSLPDVRIYFLHHYANPSPTQLGHFCRPVLPPHVGHAHMRLTAALSRGCQSMALAPLHVRHTTNSHDHGPRYPRRHAGDGRQTAEHHPEGGGDATQSLGRGRAGAALPLEAHPRVGFDQDPSRLGRTKPTTID